MSNNFIITISRQYGAGGRTVGKLLAEKLGVKYYDSELIVLAAKKNDVNSEFYKNYDEKVGKFFAGLFYYPSTIGYFSPVMNDVMVNDQLFNTQADIIKEISNEPCIIVGRCSEYILKDKPNLVRLYLYADMESRKKRIVEIYKEDAKNIEKAITKADKQRSSYYNYYTGREWGNPVNYDLCINTSKLTPEQVCNIFLKYLDDIK
jgi:cytidylate kinase